MEILPKGGLSCWLTYLLCNQPNMSMACLKMSFGSLGFKCMSLHSVFSSEILLISWRTSVLFFVGNFYWSCFYFNVNCLLLKTAGIGQHCWECLVSVAFLSVHQRFNACWVLWSKLPTEPEPQTWDPNAPLPGFISVWASVVPQTPHPQTELIYKHSLVLYVSWWHCCSHNSPDRNLAFVSLFLTCPHESETCLLYLPSLLKYPLNNLSLVSEFHLFTICHLDPCRSSSLVILPVILFSSNPSSTDPPESSKTSLSGTPVKVLHHFQIHSANPGPQDLTLPTPLASHPRLSAPAT